MIKLLNFPFKVIVGLYQVYFSLRYRLDISPVSIREISDIPHEIKAHGKDFVPCKLLPFVIFLNSFQRRAEKGFAFVDYGSGKGIAMIAALHAGFREVTGIEIAKSLHDIAFENVTKYLTISKKETSWKWHLSNNDASIYAPKPIDSVFFFFNPFDLTIFKSVVFNILKSQNQYPRNVSLVFLGHPDKCPLIDWVKLFLSTQKNILFYCKKSYILGYPFEEIEIRLIGKMVL